MTDRAERDSVKPRLPALKWLFYSPLALLPSRLVLDSLSRDLPIDRPPVWPVVVGGIVALAVVFKLLTAKRYRSASWLGGVGAAALIGCSLWRVAAGTIAHREAQVGPMLRAQATMFAGDDSLFTLADGTELISSANYSSHYGSNGRCVEVRIVGPARGFRWLRIVDAAPLPGPGGLAWPTDPADCFSTKPLAGLGK